MEAEYGTDAGNLSEPVWEVCSEERRNIDRTWFYLT
jgi:hypothetical protein